MPSEGADQTGDQSPCTSAQFDQRLCCVVRFIISMFTVISRRVTNEISIF